MGEVVHIGKARKARSEKGERMHHVTVDHAASTFCPCCRKCTICGAEGVHDFTTDLETWTLHTNPCKSLLLGQPND